jgi:hypothetical protein
MRITGPSYLHGVIVARELRMQVMAEGSETSSFRKLVKLCDLAQDSGFPPLKSDAHSSYSPPSETLTIGTKSGLRSPPCAIRVGGSSLTAQSKALPVKSALPSADRALCGAAAPDRERQQRSLTHAPAKLHNG